MTKLFWNYCWRLDFPINNFADMAHKATRDRVYLLCERLDCVITHIRVDVLNVATRGNFHFRSLIAWVNFGIFVIEQARVVCSWLKQNDAAIFYRHFAALKFIWPFSFTYNHRIKRHRAMFVEQKTYKYRNERLRVIAVQRTIQCLSFCYLYYT